MIWITTCPFVRGCFCIFVCDGINLFVVPFCSSHQENQCPHAANPCVRVHSEHNKWSAATCLLLWLPEWQFHSDTPWCSAILRKKIGFSQFRCWERAKNRDSISCSIKQFFLSDRPELFDWIRSLLDNLLLFRCNRMFRQNLTFCHLKPTLAAYIVHTSVYVRVQADVCVYINVLITKSI